MKKHILKLTCLIFLICCLKASKTYSILNRTIHDIVLYGTEEELSNAIDATNLNSQNLNGKTALFLASQYGFEKKVEILVTSGADKTLKTKQDKTALGIALAKIMETKLEMQKAKDAGDNECMIDLLLLASSYQNIIKSLGISLYFIPS